LYDLKGNLTSVAFKNGIKGKGGMPPTFRMQDHGPRQLRTALVHGLVFGSFSREVPPIDEHLGDEIMIRIARVLHGRTPALLGRYTQVLPNNWKLYMENAKDSYHASILHLFFTTFEINRLSHMHAHRLGVPQLVADMKAQALADHELAVVLHIGGLPDLALHRPGRVGESRRSDINRGSEF